MDNGLVAYLREVLIETLWNVKFLLPKGSLFLSHVLIETLWNVKT